MPSMTVIAGASNEFDAREVFRKAAPSVYLVVATTSIEDLNQGKGSIGSAVAIAHDMAITNCHVIEGQTIITLNEESSEKPISARVYKAHPSTDRCVLKTEGGLHPVQSIREASNLAIGERVYTIGNPSGLRKTLGEGLVSGLRNSGPIELVQTTAQISKGSSGGALVDSAGSLVGITTFLLRDAQNLNFAIAAHEYWK
jgi:S1-C subfamily serine protease